MSGWARRGSRLSALVVIATLATSCGAANGPVPLAGPESVASSASGLTPSSTSTLGASKAPSTTPGKTTVPAKPTAATTTAPVQPTAKTPAAQAPTKESYSSRPVPLIVIDPGHSGRSIRSTVKRTGLRDVDYPNYPEIYEVFDISSCVGEALRRDGYRVILTKRDALSSVGHAARAAIANRSRADLAISVHDDHGISAQFQATYDQRGLRGRDGRYPTLYRGTGSHRTVFSHPAVARKSQADAGIIARARTEAQHHRVSIRQNSFNGRPPLEPGNLAIVQLLSRVPWVYNEMGARTGGSVRKAMSIGSETGYAYGLLAGVESAVPRKSGTNRPTTTVASMQSCLVRRVEPSPGVFTRPRGYLPDRFG
jgi:N-acetylmuramoyl-L-alanine amidase